MAQFRISSEIEMLMAVESVSALMLPVLVIAAESASSSSGFGGSVSPVREHGRSTYQRWHNHLEPPACRDQRLLCPASLADLSEQTSRTYVRRLVRHIEQLHEEVWDSTVS